MTIKAFVEKLRGLPENQKKIIFFAVIIAAGLIILIWEVKLTKDNVQKIQQSMQAISIPHFDLPDQGLHLPSVDVGSITGQVSQGDEPVINQNSQPETTNQK